MFIETTEYQLLYNRCPHIAKKIMLMWGSRDMNVYFSDLVLNNRNGARKGFNVDIAESICYLFEKHKEEFPKLINITCKVGHEKSKAKKLCKEN